MSNVFIINEKKKKISHFSRSISRRIFDNTRDIGITERRLRRKIKKNNEEDEEGKEIYSFS